MAAYVQMVIGQENKEIARRQQAASQGTEKQ